MSKKKTHTPPKPPHQATGGAEPRNAEGPQDRPELHVHMTMYPYRYRAGNEVVIKVNNRAGYVLGVYIGKGGVEKYEVEFADNEGKAVSQYFFADQLKSVGE